MSTMTMPAVALRDMTVLPNTIIHFDVSRKKSIKAVENAMLSSQLIFLVCQKEASVNNPGFEDLSAVGCVAVVKQVLKLPGDIVRVLVEGKHRAKLLSILDGEDYLKVSVEEILGKNSDSAFENTDGEEEAAISSDYENEAKLRELKELCDAYIEKFPKALKSVSIDFKNEKELLELLDEIAANLPVPNEKKQEILEAVDVDARYLAVCRILKDEVEIARLRNEMQNGIREKIAKNQKEYILREQMGYIKKELGDDADTDTEADGYAKRLDELEATDEVKDRILKEIKRFKMLSASSSESGVARGYIETLLDMPWDKMEPENRDLGNAEAILERDHYGLKKVKERILEFLAVRNLTSKGESPIICLVGPPGTGKTSIAKSIAEALEKKYVRVCLGGVRDEAEIRGHRRTYVGALPGRIAEGIKSAKVKNPLMLLDEIDKVSGDHKGDTASALLEVLDSEQNKAFRDHYLEIPIDLSEVLFIATANYAENIPRPLYDRMEIVEVSGYTANEKFHIAKDHLLKKQLEKNGLNSEQADISDDAIRAIISGYTRESGVRSLEREIGKVLRKCARRIYENKDEKLFITEANLEEYLGKLRYLKDSVNKEDEIGIVRGLAYTSVGGDTLEIEVNTMPGRGEVTLTGKLGDVMKESAMAGLSYVRSIAEKYGIKAEYFKSHDFHIHVPEGAVPKDGPSAGITMATALLSAVTKSPVRFDVAMTGEITLRGRVLPIGGLKEKLLAAKLAGVKKVMVPFENEKDVSELDAEITDDLKIVFVKSMDDVIPEVFRDGVRIKPKKKSKQD